MGKQPTPSPVMAQGTRLVVPVLSAVGGSGRSIVANLLACALAPAGATVVLDTAPRLSSPWPAWASGAPSGGLAALPADQPLSPAQVRQAASWQPGLDGSSWQVLTDGRDWHTPPLDLPDEPAAWHQLSAIGGWQAVVADTAHPMAHDVLAARCAGRQGQTRGWCELPYAIPVLCAAATAAGIQALQQAVMTLHAEGLPLQRAVVALVATTDGRTPAVVRAGATMLGPRTAAVVHLPYDPGIRAHGLGSLSRLRPRTRQAAGQLAAAVHAAARAAWGDPLPHAPRPAPLSVPVPAL
ncbi:hypothetical protein [Streptomyces violascens]|uniref:hypothetical protein n=1 Tax=Streptomyces violascens TaxID=67381 RepID=UPI0036B30A46